MHGQDNNKRAKRKSPLQPPSNDNEPADRFERWAKEAASFGSPDEAESPPITVREFARCYVARGCNPVPFARGEKGPSGRAGRKWQERVVTEENIDRWFSDAGNIGLQLGPKSHDLGDVDLDSPEAVRLADKFLPRTQAEFGRKSKPRSHRLYIITDAPPDTGSVSHRDGEGKMVIQVRLGTGDKGAQSMCPPSIHPGGEKVEWYVLGKPARVSYAVLIRAVQLLAVASLLFQHWPEKSGSRHDLALRVGGFLKRAGLTDDEVEQVVETVAYEAGDEEAKDRVRGAADATKYGFPALAEALGNETAEALAKILDFNQTQGLIEELNKTYAAVTVGGRPRIIEFDASGRIEEFLIIDAMRQRLASKGAIRVGNRMVSVFDYWNTNPQRREYKGVEFNPKSSRPGYYNYWQGLAVAPKEGDCSKFLAHVRDNVCSSNEELFVLIIGWLAHMIQRPWDKIGVALVLRGEEGVGKTIIGEIIGDLLGIHYVLVSNARYVTGNFNKHMHYAILLQIDEGFWAGDRSAEGTLKSLITSCQHHIELKGIDQFMVANYIRALITSNSEWIVPAGFKARRWIVVDVNEQHRNDKAYFQAIRDEDRGALLHYLLNFDLSKVDFSKIPQTEALLDQKLASLNGEQSWWLDLLHAGILPSAVNQRDEKDELKLDEKGNPTSIPNSCYVLELYESYAVHAKTQGISRRAIETRMGTFLKRIVRPHTIVKNRLGKDRVACYVLPSLKDCRKAFEAHIQHSIDWEEGLEEWINK